MKIEKLIYLILFFQFLPSLSLGTNVIKYSPLEIYFEKPAVKWNAALPIGNGFMGGMVYGDHYKDHIQLNEKSLCTGKQISPIDTPELADAALTSLKARGDQSVGWSTSWRICLYARLFNPDKAHQYIRSALTKSVFPNLFGAYMYGNSGPFQIDGNFGYTAGIVEMLLQNHGDTIYLLPSIPQEWHTGAVYGMCAMNGFTIDMEWKNGKITNLIVHSKLGGLCKLRIEGNNKQLEIKTQKGDCVKII